MLFNLTRASKLTYFKQPNNLQNYASRLPLKAKHSPRTWILISFLTVLSHGVHIVSSDVNAYGSLIKDAVNVGQPTHIHPRGYLNTQALWNQWFKFCYLILNLKGYKISIFILCSEETQKFANALSWNYWTNSLIQWRGLITPGLNVPNVALIKSSNTCLVDLNNFLSRTNKSSLWQQVPSFGVNTPPKFDNVWLGITSTKQHPSLQYFILTCIFKHAK